MRYFASLLILAAVSCGPVPSIAQDLPAPSTKLPVTFVTHPSKCEAEGGCVLISRAQVLADIKAAANAKTSVMCRRDSV